MTEIAGKIKATGATFVRFYPSDWRSGCIGLTCEQEGFYWRICAHYYETGARLPLDDDEARSRLGCMDRRAYRRLKNDLIAKGLMHERDDGYSIPRCEEELRAALARTARATPETDVVAPRENAPKASDHRRAADEPGREVAAKSEQSPTEVSANSERIRPDFADLSEQNQGALIEPVAIAIKETPKPPLGASGQKFDWRTAFATADDHAGIEIGEGGTLMLVNGTRQHWLEQFGSEADLANALREAHAAVNPGSRKSLKVQVEAKLASIIRDLKARKQNALAIAAANKPSAKPIRASRW